MTYTPWLQHIAALLLILATLAPASRQLRLGVIASAIAALAYALLAKHHTALAVWSGLLFTTNMAKLAQIEWGERRARFAPREDHLRAKMLPGLSRPHARALIDRGNWLNGKPGERLMTEGEPAAHLFFLHEGVADVSFAGAPVELSASSELWCIWADELRHYVSLHPEVRAVLERQLNDALRAKLSGANRLLAARA